MQAGYSVPCPDLIVQFAGGDPALLVLLGLAEAAEQVKPFRLCPLARLDVRYDAVDKAGACLWN